VIKSPAKRGALTTGMDPGQARPSRPARSLDLFGEYLQSSDLFEGHPLSGML